MFNTLSDFISDTIGIIRWHKIAELVTHKDKAGQPVKLIGFRTGANKTNFEIYEEAYLYYKELEEIIDATKANQRI